MLAQAIGLLQNFESDVVEIVALSLRVSLTAVALATLIGLPLGALVAVARFPGRGAAVVVLNSFMGLPPVIVGVAVYLLLSRSGPLGPLGLLFTPSAMIVAQTCLTLPLIAALARQTVEDAWRQHGETLRSLRVPMVARVRILLWDCRFSLVAVLLAGLGRALSEVGAVMIVGGNIDRATRVMTTAIALEISKGDLALSIALGIVLMTLVFGLNILASGVRAAAMLRHGH
ncbi:MAG: ABC transporter permease [Lautropia sp.]|nr:MAG: ABC transporter permease [Pseudomonadota bacterium]MBC6960048.1 ABC transporter permease [Lautropia sp.]MCL4702306.1 ABC transporter permease [Burkholderiaceae bacterium]MDL1907565.1 ABC transporter permease [Betaproteobacteria bacterium PRO1]RIK89919.1 MAG: ABC transporter permease [Burkholderiales bacterium]